MAHFQAHDFALVAELDRLSQQAMHQARFTMPSIDTAKRPVLAHWPQC